MAEIRFLSDVAKELHTRGGPPDNGGMDARVTRLEEFAGESRERMARVETKLDNVVTEVSQFKWWLIGTVLAVIFTVIGTSVGIQQMTVATFQAAGQQAQPAATQQPIIINVPGAAAPAQPTQTPKR